MSFSYSYVFSPVRHFVSWINVSQWLNSYFLYKEKCSDKNLKFEFQGIATNYRHFVGFLPYSRISVSPYVSPQDYLKKDWTDFIQFQDGDHYWYCSEALWSKFSIGLKFSTHTLVIINKYITNLNEGVQKISFLSVFFFSVLSVVSPMTPLKKVLWRTYPVCSIFATKSSQQWYNFDYSSFMLLLFPPI